MSLLPPLFSPLDEELSLLPGPLTPRLVDDLVHRGTWMPFPVAARNLGRFSGVQVSEPTARRWTEKAGVARVAHETAAVERLLRGEVPTPPGPLLQQVSVDGAMVPLVAGAWSEVKTVAIGTVGEPVWEKDHFAVHTQDISYFSRCADHLTFSHQASLETQRRGTATAGTVLGIVDGVDWEQGFLDDQRRDALRILDWGHAAEHLAQAGQALFGVGIEKVSAWLGSWLHALRHGAPETVLAELRQRIGEPDREETARGAAAKHLTYLEERREQIRYAAFEAQGFPIGSAAAVGPVGSTRPSPAARPFPLTSPPALRRPFARPFPRSSPRPRPVPHVPLPIIRGVAPSSLPTNAAPPARLDAQKRDAHLRHMTLLTAGGLVVFSVQPNSGCRIGTGECRAGEPIVGCLRTPDRGESGLRSGRLALSAEPVS
jgi:hypothetical protein